MKKSANSLMLYHARRFFEGRGCDVQVKASNGDGGIVLAVLGPASDRIGLLDMENVPGVQSYERDNTFLFKHQDEFVEAWQYFEKKQKSGASS